MKEFESFAALIYVTDIEEKFVKTMYPWEEMSIEGDAQKYYRATTDGGKSIYAARQDEMGMTAAATLTMKLIDHFRPRYVIMPGIAAGAMDEDSNVQEYGDVLLASKVWNYSNGKYVPKERASIIFGEIGFQPRPTCVTMPPELLAYLEKAVHCEQNQCYVHFGELTSGSAVVAIRSVMNALATILPNTKGLEMEGYGVAYAASHATEPQPYAIIAKSICDFANDRKSDKYQRLAAYTSCEFVRMMLENVLE